MEWFDNGWGLTLITFLPLVGAVLIGLMPKTQEETIKQTALGTSIVVLGLSIIAALRFDYGSAADFQLRHH